MVESLEKVLQLGRRKVVPSIPTLDVFCLTGCHSQQTLPESKQNFSKGIMRSQSLQVISGGLSLSLFFALFCRASPVAHSLQAIFLQ